MNFFLASFSLALSPALLSAQQPRSFPLNCRAGVGLPLSVQTGSHGMTGTSLVGTFLYPEQARRPRPGECTWDDRPLSRREPNRFCMALDGPDLRRSGGSELVAALSGTDGVARLAVYNNGRGCLVVTRVMSSSTSRETRSGVSFDELRKRLPHRTTRTPGSDRDGKADDVVGPGSLPRPPQVGREAERRLRTHGDTLLRLTRTLLDAPTLKQYQDHERSLCRNDIFCLIDMRSTAIAVAVERR